MNFETVHWEKFQDCEHLTQPTFGKVPRNWARWVRCAGPHEQLLADSNIGRESLVELWSGSSDCDLLFISTMAWGNMTVKNGKAAWENRTIWLPIIEAMLSGAHSRSSIYEKFCAQTIPGMGPAYYTKLIHFGMQGRSTNPGYIMDQWTSKSVNLLIGKPLINLDYAGYVSRQNPVEVYEEYCAVVEEIAGRLKLEPRLAEEWLFSKGKPNPAEWRSHVAKHWRRAKSNA